MRCFNNTLAVDAVPIVIEFHFQINRLDIFYRYKKYICPFFPTIKPGDIYSAKDKKALKIPFWLVLF